MLELNYNHLYYFQTIAQQGSIVRASKALHLTQPTLSGQLKQLEDYLGKKLFHRKVRKLELNADGKLVLEYARKIFALGDELVRSVREETAQRIELVRLGMLPSLSKTLIHRFILPFFDREGIAVQVQEFPLPQLLRGLETGDLDLALSDSPGPRTGKKFENYPLRHRHFVVVGTKAFAWAKKNFPKSLQGVPFATFTEHSQIRSEIDHYFQSKKIFPKLVGEFDDIVLLQFVAERGKCLTLLPKHSVAEALQSRRLEEIGAVPGIESEVWAVARKGSKKGDRYLRMLHI